MCYRNKVDLDRAIHHALSNPNNQIAKSYRHLKSMAIDEILRVASVGKREKVRDTSQRIFAKGNNQLGKRERMLKGAAGSFLLYKLSSRVG